MFYNQVVQGLRTKSDTRLMMVHDNSAEVERQRWLCGDHAGSPLRNGRRPF